MGFFGTFLYLLTLMGLKNFANFDQPAYYVIDDIRREESRNVFVGV